MVPQRCRLLRPARFDEPTPAPPKDGGRVYLQVDRHSLRTPRRRVRCEPVRGAGGGRDEENSPGLGEARLLAMGVLVQQAAQAAGLIALLAVVTLLARRLPVAALGAYGLVASLAGYLLVFRNSVASSTVRALSETSDREERVRTFSAAVALYAAVGLATSALIGVAGVAIAETILSGTLARQARVGALGLGLVTGLGILASVCLDALRAERLFVRAALTEMVGVGLYLVVMLTLILSDADLAAVIALSGGMPLMSGALSFLTIRRLRLPLRVVRAGMTRSYAARIAPTSGWLLVIEVSNLVMYALDRVILGAFRSPATVARYEGPVRAHNLLYALSGALSVPTVPTVARYLASEDRRRLRELVLRGTRYTLMLFVPLCVVLMALAEPLLDVWLGERYGDGWLALTILTSYWLLYGGLVVTPGFLVGAGRARQLATIVAVMSCANLAISLALTPELGLEGPALGTAVPFVLAFPVVLRLGLSVGGVRVVELASRAWLPAYLLAGVLAAALLALRAVAGLDSLPEVVAAGVGGVVAYWAVCYLVWFDRDERALIQGLLRST
jgi:O-antigen/teichoic acid export membrane protein